MKNNIKFIWELIKLRLSHIMTFRLGFFGPFFIDTSYFLVQIFAFEAIYGHVDSIRGWGHGEILIFIGTFSLINALNMTIYFFGVISIPEKIQTGELERMHHSVWGKGMRYKFFRYECFGILDDGINNDNTIL